MNWLTNTLLSGQLYWRLLFWLTLMVLVSFLLWLTLLVPVWRQQTALHSQYQQLHQQQTQLQQKLRQLPASSPEITLTRPAPLPVFSLAQTPGITLIRWEPQEQTASSPATITLSELTLYCDWQQIPLVFNTLAEHQALPRAFSLQTVQQHLQLTLHLETPDAEPIANH